MADRLAACSVAGSKPTAKSRTPISRHRGKVTPKGLVAEGRAWNPIPIAVEAASHRKRASAKTPAVRYALKSRALSSSQTKAIASTARSMLFQRLKNRCVIPA